MQKQKSTHNSSLKVVHQTKNRVRFICDKLSKNSDVAYIEAGISEFKYVKDIRVNSKAKSIIVTYKSNLQDIISFIENFEFKDINKKPNNFEFTSIYKSLIALIISKISNNISLNSAVSLYASMPIFMEGFKELYKQGLTSKVLEALAIGVSLARKDYVATNGTSFLINLGEYIEETTVNRSDELIKELAKPTTNMVWKEIRKNHEKTLIQISIKDIKVGDIIVVSSGENIAIDGYIVEGSASINQVSMTGEAQPVKKERGDRVISGTVVEEGKIKIWAELVGGETAIERVKKYIQSSLNEKSQITLQATRLADKLVPVTLALAGLSYTINKNMTSVASVLQADYSCALKLATPVAFKSAISKAGRNGILVKGAKSIEALCDVDTFVFDKTGTLTYGKLDVVEIYSFDKNFTQLDVLNLTASAEEHYFHPVAEAIVNAAKEKGFKHIHHDEVEFIVAHGLKTEVKGKSVIIGSRHFLEEDEKISFDEHRDIINPLLEKGLTLLYIAYDNRLLGTIAMQDTIRKNAKESIERLHKLGVKEVIMLTGDIQSKADEVAKELGIDNVFSQCLPTQKADIIKKLKQEGKKVAFVGDGINDAPSLISADVGISMQKGADIAKVTADISLMKDDLSGICYIKELANANMKLVNLNFKAAVMLNSLILLGAVFNKISPVTTALLHNGTTVALLTSAAKGAKIKEKND